MLHDDGFATTRLVPPDPMFALAALFAYGVQTKHAHELRQTRDEPLPLETPTQHDVWERLTSAGRLLLDRLSHAQPFTRRRPGSPNMGAGATTA